MTKHLPLFRCLVGLCLATHAAGLHADDYVEGRIKIEGSDTWTFAIYDKVPVDGSDLAKCAGFPAPHVKVSDKSLLKKMPDATGQFLIENEIAGTDRQIMQTSADSFSIKGGETYYVTFPYGTAGIAPVNHIIQVSSANHSTFLFQVKAAATDVGKTLTVSLLAQADWDEGEAWYKANNHSKYKILLNGSLVSQLDKTLDHDFLHVAPAITSSAIVK